MTRTQKLLIGAVFAVLSGTGAVAVSVISNVASAYFIQKYELNK